MNPYRCETCKKFPAGSIFDGSCPQVNKLPCDWDVPIDVWCAITSMIGCASHSDFQSEREKVLDEVFEKYMEIRTTPDYHIVLASDFEIMIEELRKGDRE